MTLYNDILGQAGAANADFASLVVGVHPTIAMVGGQDLISNNSPGFGVSGTLGFSNSTGTLLSGNPNLGPFQNYGGPTETLALTSISGAVGQGIPIISPTAITTDQRGVERNATVPDIGAYQYTLPAQRSRA